LAKFKLFWFFVWALRVGKNQMCLNVRSVFYNEALRFADLRWAGFLPLMFMRSTKLSATTKLSAEHETPPIANVLLAVGFLSSFNICPNEIVN
jgi:hypothetical protein